MTDQQKKFLEVLFTDEAEGDVRKAMTLAGYSEGTSKKTVTDALAEEITDAAKKFLASEASIKAAWTMYSSLEQTKDKSKLLGMKERIAAAKDIMNRGGLIESKEIKLDAESPLFILPPKDEDKE